MTKDEPKKRGRKTPWSPTLSDNVKRNRSFPPEIHDMLEEVPVKRLLNSMAVDPGFKQAILELVPEKELQQKSP